MSGATFALILEGDQTSNIKEVLETYDCTDVKDFCVATDFFYKDKLYSPAQRDYKAERNIFFYLIGFYKGWTVVEQIEPSICYRECCIRASALTNGKVINIADEGHTGYTGLIYSDKGHAIMHIEQTEWGEITRTDGAPFQIDESFDEYMVNKIIEPIIGFNVFDLLYIGRKEKIDNIKVKSAYKSSKIQQWY